MGGAPRVGAMWTEGGGLWLIEGARGITADETQES